MGSSPSPSISPAHTSRTAIVPKAPPPVVSVPKLEVTSRDGYSHEEKKVLEKTSFINSRVYIPFLEEDTKERFHFPLPFTDKDGMLELSPKQKKEFAKWCRISDLHPEPSIIAGTHADFYSIKQTLVSDCSFVSSLTVAALYERTFNRRILTSIIYPRNAKGPIYNSSGKYTVKLFINGIARKVVVDDHLPIGKYNQLLCSYSSNKSEFWISLMEKAYMKVMGGYDFPGSNSNIDCYALTGWIPERITIRKNEPDFDANGVFNRLKEGFEQGRCLITVATGELSDAECDRTGLVATHAFAVVNMAEVNGIKLLMLKNPWSHMKWKGNYSTNDTAKWTIELQNQLNYDLETAKNVDNGVFWIDYHSLLNFFDVFYLNWDPELFKYTYCTHSLWNSGIGPSKDCYSVGDNPQYSLKVPAGRGSIYVLLTRHITTIEDFRENREYITLLVYNHNNGKRVYYPHDPSPYIDGVRINSPHYLCKIRLDPASSRNYTLVLSQFLKTTTIFYTLRAYCREAFELKAINNNYATNMTVNGEWKTDNLTAGGCPNNRTYVNNPLFKVVLPSDGNLIIELRGPKVYQVKMNIFDTLNFIN